VRHKSTPSAETTINAATTTIRVRMASCPRYLLSRIADLVYTFHDRTMGRLVSEG
jgi:hypothetical protein